jgi:hypothetical protein
MSAKSILTLVQGSAGKFDICNGSRLLCFPIQAFHQLCCWTQLLPKPFSSTSSCQSFLRLLCDVLHTSSSTSTAFRHISILTEIIICKVCVLVKYTLVLNSYYLSSACIYHLVLTYNIYMSQSEFCCRSFCWFDCGSSSFKELFSDFSRNAYSSIC